MTRPALAAEFEWEITMEAGTDRWFRVDLPPLLKTLRQVLADYIGMKASYIIGVATLRFDEAPVLLPSYLIILILTIDRW